MVGDLQDHVGVVGRAEVRVAELLGAAADVADVVPGPPGPDVLAVPPQLADQGGEPGSPGWRAGASRNRASMAWASGFQSR